jgi:acyl carrier protein
MTHQEAVGLVTRLICRQRKLEPSQVTEDIDLVQAFGFDSLDAAEMLAALHKETGRELAACSIQSLTTVGSIASHLTDEGSSK